MQKAYVSVELVVDEAGEILPTAIIWEDGQKFPIDRVTDIRYAASRKAGGIGTRYTCKILGHERYLFFENPKWFVEKGL